MTRSFSKIKYSITLFLVFFLAGCSSILPVVIFNEVSKSNIKIASDIPKSSVPCIQIKRSNQSELSVRENISSTAGNNFLLGEFNKLEEDYNLYRHRESRTPSGRWKLQYFYLGLLSKELENSLDMRSWERVDEKIHQWQKQYPNSPLPYVAYSDFLINLAWHFRGESFAKNVAPEAWDKFYKNIDLARSTLEYSKKISSADPQWYTNMIYVAKAQSWSKLEVNKILKEALSKEPYYQETYHAVFSYLLPKWSGSFVEAEQFADQAAIITSKCEGRSMYARLYWKAFVEDREFADSSFDSTHTSWKKMSEGFEDLNRDYPSSWNLNNYARFACLARDKEKTIELMNKIHKDVVIEAWINSTNTNFVDCQRWAFPN
jgi:hypothetical protein